MSLQSIKAKLQSSEYSFLRENEHLGSRIILLTTGGSYAYGTNVATSDTDVRGVAVERKNEIMGFGCFEQFEDRTTDTVIYGLRKMINLALSCNPNVLEILGTKPEHLFIITKEGQALRDNIELFLSKKVIQSFGNYATAQLRRLQNALARDNYPQPEKEKHILNSVLGQMEHFKRIYTEFTDEQIHLYIDKSEKEEFETEIFMDVELKHYPLRDFKCIYSEMHNVVKDYSKLNHRNSKKDELHLNKHAMHLIRLLVTGTEILEGKSVHTYREKERDLLLQIRDGQYSYSQIFAMVDELELKFRYAAEHTSLPDAPDYGAAEELLISIYDNML